MSKKVRAQRLVIRAEINVLLETLEKSFSFCQKTV